MATYRRSRGIDAIDRGDFVPLRSDWDAQKFVQMAADEASQTLAGIRRVVAQFERGEGISPDEAEKQLRAKDSF